ncbi:MAG: type II toxin-antitoxin system VapC family toxin [Elusimicrobia bacterium]|nr:type II toxin-antitoxin system VapC family toxin [Elusimicrobiota bacterium]
MILIDVNVLVYAFRADAQNHEKFRQWLNKTVNSDQAFGMADQVLSGFLRIVTHPKIFNPPTPLETALSFVEILRSSPNCVLIAPGPTHWEIFVRLCKAAHAKGNYIADAYLAALAIESGSEWITTDRDYSRFPGLRWRHPLER